MAYLIPKIIYKIWISDRPCPEYFKRYTDTWKKFMPDYEIREITLANIPRTFYINNLIAQKKWTVLNHYIRYYLLYTQGGIYLDLDVEVVKSFDDLLNSDLFAGWEDAWVINNAVMGSRMGMKPMLDCMHFMEGFDPNNPNAELETGPRLTTKMIPKDKALPPEYFFPYHYTQDYYPECIKENTHSVHHWKHSWNSGVSIIIPCYKQAHWLKDAIESCLFQTVPPLEIIVVNDGSPDNTSEVARQYKQVKLIEKENGGLSSARNAGIKEAKGKYILTLDADDKLHPDFIKKTIGLDDIVGTAQQEFGDSNTLWHPPHKHPTHANFIPNNCINCCSIYLKEIWEKVGGYDESMRKGYEDWFFWMKAVKLGYKVTTIDEPLFYYRKHGRSMVNDARDNHNEIYKYMIDNINK